MKKKDIPLSRVSKLIDEIAENKQHEATTQSELPIDNAKTEQHKPMKWEYHGKLNTVHLFQLKKEGEFDNAILFILQAAQYVDAKKYHVIYEKLGSNPEKKYDMLDADQIEHIFGINVANVIKEGDISFNGLLRHIHSNINDLQNTLGMSPDEQMNQFENVLQKFFYGNSQA